jgi:hypothetical protein
MADRINDLKCNDATRQQPQGPVGISLGRRAQPEGNHLSLLLAAKDLCRRRLFPLFSMQDLLKTLRHKPLTQVLNGTGSAIERLRNPRVRPNWAGLIGLQQHLRSPDLLA